MAEQSLAAIDEADVVSVPADGCAINTIWRYIAKHLRQPEKPSMLVVKRRLMVLTLMQQVLTWQLGVEDMYQPLQRTVVVLQHWLILLQPICWKHLKLSRVKFRRI